LSAIFCAFFYSNSSPSFANSELIATVLNSPVKETYLEVKLEGLKSISSVYFMPKNGGKEVQGELVQENGQYIGKLKTSELKPGLYEYRLKARSPSGIFGIGRAASVDFISFLIDTSLEVADPGEEGQKTLLGIDSDNDGVRDDVQRWINEIEKNEKIKKLMKYKAKGIQLTFLHKDNKELSIQHTRESLRAQICLTDLQIEAGVPSKEIVDRGMILVSMMANTKPRILAKRKVSSNFHGESVSLEPKTTSPQACNF
jgi:hypothetical protein